MSWSIPADALPTTLWLVLASVDTSHCEDGGCGGKENKEWVWRSDPEIGRGLKTDDLNGSTSRFHVTTNYWQPKSRHPSLGMSTNFDRRRINGPEESFSPVFVDDDEDETKWRPGKPRQPRQPHDIRPICNPSASWWSDRRSNLVTTVLQPGLISQANGSAYIETERTKIACAVYVQSATVLQLGRQTKWRSVGMVLASRKAQVTVNVAASMCK